MNKIQIYPVQIKQYNYMIVFNGDCYLCQIHDLTHFMNIIKEVNKSEERTVILKEDKRLFVGWKYKKGNVRTTANCNFHNVIVPDKIDVLITAIENF